MHIKPFGSHSVVGWYVDGVGVGVVFNGHTQICDDRCAVVLHQDIFGLEVSVGDRRFPLKNQQGEKYS